MEQQLQSITVAMVFTTFCLYPRFSQLVPGTTMSPSQISVTHTKTEYEHHRHPCRVMTWVTSMTFKMLHLVCTSVNLQETHQYIWGRRTLRGFQLPPEARHSYETLKLPRTLHLTLCQKHGIVKFSGNADVPNKLCHCKYNIALSSTIFELFDVE